MKRIIAAGRLGEISMVDGISFGHGIELRHRDNDNGAHAYVTQTYIDKAGKFAVFAFQFSRLIRHMGLGAK